MNVLLENGGPESVRDLLQELRIDGDPEKNSKIQKQIQQFTQKHGRLFMMRLDGRRFEIVSCGV